MPKTLRLTKKAIRRITILRNFMRRLPKSANDHFAMSHFFHPSRPITLVDKKPITRKALQECGTSACAAGWAAVVPAFRRAGYTYSPVNGFSIEPEVFFDLRGARNDGGSGNYANTMLFYHDGVHTPKQWAKRATALLKQAEPI